MFRTFVALVIVVILSISPSVVSGRISASVHPTYAEYSLGGVDWSVQSTNGSIRLSKRAKVPGDIYADLMNNNVIGDPFYRYGDQNYRWVAYENWTYEKSFQFPPPNFSISTAYRVQLVFDGLQVVSRISLDHAPVGMSLDQFQQYTFDVTGLLLPSTTPKNHSLQVKFMSSVAYGGSQFAAYPLSPKPDAPPYIMGLPYRNMIRAEQSSFGWDWGPAFAPQGIYRRVYLRVYNSPSQNVHIDHIVPHIFPLPFNTTVDFPLSDTNNSFLINVRIFVDALDFFLPSMLKIVVQGSASMGSPVNSSMISVNSRNATKYEVSVDLYVKNVPLWWPKGYGSQPLHSLNVSVYNSMNQRLDSKDTKIGLRSVEMITWGDPLKYKSPTTAPPPPEDFPNPGDNNITDRGVMFFRINGIPIFAKGSNLIPFDAFQSRVNDSVMADILDSAVAANMNMVRVWGGGLFPEESFYRMCDERGLMVWQEMIFACAEYPIDGPFLQLVRSEISFQMRRLGSHPSIMVWSGNNENGVYDKGPGSPYEILDYDNVLYQIIREDTSRPIWPSSPSRGFKSGVTASGLPAGTLDNPLPFVVGGNSGDSHYYNYFSCPNVEFYPRTNFGSEFGFQSLPWLDNFKPVSEPQDWYLFSPLMEHRQHHEDGNEEIAKLLAQNFRIPNLNTTDVTIFRRVIYLSQLQQVLCLADEASYYRRGRNMFYRTMGSLYWQLNQNWQAPSWTSIEYGGEWKVLHYAMKAVYEPIHTSAYFNATTGWIYAHVASDAVHDVQATMEVEVIALSSTIVPSAKVLVSIPLTVPALSGSFFWALNRSQWESNPAMVSQCSSNNLNNCFLMFHVLDPVSKAELCTPQIFWFNTVKDLQADPNATVVISDVSVALTTATLSVSVSANSGPALFVMVRSLKYRGTFSSNMLHIVPGRVVQLSFQTKPNMNGVPQYIRGVTDFVNSLSIEYLNQMW